jgi:hypothetical protein
MAYDHAKQIKSNETYFEKGTGYKVVVDEYRFRRCPQCGKNRQKCTHQFKEAYNKNDEIMYESEIIVCMYSPNENLVDTGIGTGYEYVQHYHEFVSSDDKKLVVAKKIERPTASVEEKKLRSSEELEFINCIYRGMRGLLHKYLGTYLYKEDRQDLLKRFMMPKEVESLKKAGLWEEHLKIIDKKKERLTLNQLELLKKREKAEKKIEKAAFFSVPSRNKKVTYIEKDATGTVVKKYECKLQTAILKDLYVIAAIFLKTKNNVQKVTEKEVETELLKVPGFVVTENKEGSQYIAFKHYKLEGYFVPYINFNAKIEAMQVRLTNPFVDSNGKPMRYFWYSSEQASSGSPIDYYMPEEELERYDVLFITEGASKMRVACEYLKFQGMGEAGVGNYRSLVKSILEYENHMGVQFKIIVALDMDKNTIRNKDGRYPVLEAENSTVALLKATGHQVAIAEWDIKKGKGIDDALINGAKLKYKLV